MGHLHNFVIMIKNHLITLRDPEHQEAGYQALCLWNDHLYYWDEFYDYAEVYYCDDDHHDLYYWDDYHHDFSSLLMIIMICIIVMMITMKHFVGNEGERGS